MKTSAAGKIVRENFARMKYLSLVFVAFSAYTLFTNYALPGIWNSDAIGIYRVLDVVFAGISVAALLFFWLYKAGSHVVMHSVTVGVYFLVLVWSGLVTSVEFTSIGFSTLITITLVGILFLRFNLATSVLFFTGVNAALAGGVLAWGHPDPAAVTMLFTMIPFTAVALALSQRNYSGRVNELNAAARLEDVNEELATAKEHLEDEVGRRTAELNKAKLKAEESDRLKSAFLTNISHEIRTPMNGIIGFAELLKEPGLTGEEKQEYIANIERSSDRMLNIINDIVDISTISSGLARPHMCEVDIDALMGRAHALFDPIAREKGLHLRLNNELSGTGATIFSDGDKLSTCIAHLMKNAVKFTEVGAIELGCRWEGYGGGGATAAFFFYVKDTGIGVSEERQEAIFERFVQADIADTRAFQGAGLGLSITKAYVQMLGGTIRVESNPGEGAVFSFTIPPSAPAETAATPSAPVARPGGEAAATCLKILVVDDDDGSLQYLKGALREISREILSASDGAAAVAICQGHPDVDVVLMDIKMPIMDGYRAIRLIRQFNQRVIIIAQTAFALAGDREKSLNAGADDYLTKPLSRTALLACVADNLGRRGAPFALKPGPVAPSPSDSPAGSLRGPAST